MKILLNLLPEENKKNIQSKFYFRFFLWQLFLVFALEVFYASMLVSIYFVLDFQLQGLQLGGQQYDNAHAEQKTLGVYQQKFKETNEAVDIIGHIDQSHFSFTKVFLLLDTVTPDGIVIDHVTTKNYTVLLTGTAATRDDLLAFDTGLKGSACTENVNVPLSNLFSQRDVEFQIDFGIKKECLRDSL